MPNFLPQASLTAAMSTFIAGLLTVLSLPAIAHTPYVAPTSFDTVMGKVASFDASFAETFFVPEAAFTNSEFMITTPSGKQQKPDQVVALKTRVVVEHELAEEGTYRLTTGARFGAVFMIYDLDGKEERVMNPKKPLPKGAILKQHFQSVTRADTYVSRKQTSSRAMAVGKAGLQVLPLDNPTDVFADEAFRIKLILNNKKLMAQEVLVFAAHTNAAITTKDSSAEAKSYKFSTDSNGIAEITLPAGEYLLRARHRGPVPESEQAKAPNYSQTTTLSFQVFENI